MPVLDNMIRRVRTTGENPATSRYPNWTFASRSNTGRVYSDEAALSLTAVYDCVRLISTVAGGLPLHVFEKQEDGSSREIETSDTAYLWSRPNVEQTMQTFWETVYGHEAMGDSFLFVDKNFLGLPADEGLWYVEPWRVRVGRLREAVGRIPARTKIYEIDNELPMIDYRQGGEIVHIPNWGRSTLRGLNPLSVAAQAVDLGLSAEEYAARFFSENSVPPGIISSEQDLSPEQAAKLAAQWQAGGAGLANLHRTRVLSNGAKFQQISISPEESQLLEERKFQVSEIARLFGIPPHLVGDVERSTSWGSGIEEQTLGWLSFGLTSHIKRFEQAINDALLVRQLTRRYVKFDLRGLLRGTTLRRYQAYKLADWMTDDEKRELEDMAPLPNGAGAKLLKQVNMAPVENLGEAAGVPV